MEGLLATQISLSSHVRGTEPRAGSDRNKKAFSDNTAGFHA